MPLFRSEVLAERTAPRWGAVVISRAPALGWASLALVLIALVGLGLVLSLDYARKVRISGYLEPSGGIAQVIAPASGRVAALHVGDGQRVAAGQVLAVLDHDRYSEQGRQVHGEEAAYLQASIQRLRQRAGADAEKQAAERRALHEEIDLLAQEQEALRDELQFTEEQRTLLSIAEERLLKLMTAGLIASAAYEQERQRALAAALSKSRVQRSLAANERQLGQARAALVRLDQTHQAQRLALEQEQADVSRKLARLAEQRQTAVVSPRSGVVTFMQFAKGDRVAAEQVLMAVAPEGGEPSLVLLAHAEAAADLSVGNEVRFKALGAQRRKNPIGIATIRELSQTPQKPYLLRSWVTVDVPVFRAKAAISKFPDDFPRRNGMRVDAYVVTQSRTLWRWLTAPLIGAMEGL